MQTDRELLELAAKAAGQTLNEVRLGEQVIGFMWNPLTNDGEALQLAVKLRFDITFYDGFQEVHVEHASGVGEATYENYGSDVLSATRRAIVRAAAAIGASL